MGDQDETTFNLETKVENAIYPHEMPGIQYETPETTEECNVSENMDDDLNDSAEASADNADTDATEVNIQILVGNIQQVVQNQDKPEQLMNNSIHHNDEDIDLDQNGKESNNEINNENEKHNEKENEMSTVVENDSTQQEDKYGGEHPI